MENKRKVLIVEDEVLVREGLKSVIGWDKLGMEVVGDAANGRQALEIYERERPDIVLTDIRMPVMDGLELIARIREEDKKTGIVILTCYEEFGYLQEALRMGVSDYILKLKMKPAEIEAAMAKVKKKLDEDEENGAGPDGAEEFRLQKEEELKRYIFYHQVSIGFFRSRMERLSLAVKEKDMVLLRVVIQRYEKARLKIMDDRGMLIRFVILNTTEEIMEKYGGGETIQEGPDCFLLFMNVVNDPKDEDSWMEKMQKEISHVLSNFMGVRAVWGVSGVFQSFTELPDKYQECCQKMQDERVDLSVEIYEAVRYIEGNLTQRLTLNQVASSINLSPNYLSSLFKKELGVGFVDYITEKRVERAKELLENTGLKTYEVAQQAGFVDESYFSKTFKRLTGKRPSAFRKRNGT
ncbi:MAG: response regulator [Lachnospiraceae bacterium]|nr:response regulator [Lachnospiraceae bacterium]